MKPAAAWTFIFLALSAPAWAQAPDAGRENAPSREQPAAQSLGNEAAPPSVSLGEASGTDATVVAPGASLGKPDASLTAPPAAARLPTPLDADIESRIDKGLTAAGEASAVPPDYAFGAFQRGYFLSAFSLALDRAKRGDAAAQTLLGELLSRGLGVKQDLAAAADWYGLAAAQSDAEALYALGRFNLDGTGVKQDPAKAADLLEQAAKKGHAVAAREFAYLLLQGKGRPRNALLGAAYLRRAAGLGDMDAQFALGGLYVEGVGVVADAAQAARWYGEAARNGHVEAEVEYAIMLFNGRGVKKDEAVAARWFHEAAGADNPLAQIRLARLYAQGRGVDRSAAEAARWYLIAKSRGLQDAFMENWLTGLDKATLSAATEAAGQWTRFRRGPGQPVAPPSSAPRAKALPMDNTAE